MIKFQMCALAAVFAACAVLSACSSDTKNLIGDKIGSLDASSIAGMASGDSAAAGDSSKSKKKYSGGDTAGDAQYIQPDDFFISEEPFKGQNWIRVTLAKQLKAPSAQTKSEGQFMQVLDGKEVWTKYYYRTRIATSSDIRMGAVIIALDVCGDEEVYRAPESKEDARTSPWFMAKITDVSDLHKGFVTVSGGYKVSVEALRIQVKLM